MTCYAKGFIEVLEKDASKMRQKMAIYINLSCFIIQVGVKFTFIIIFLQVFFPCGKGRDIAAQGVQMTVRNNFVTSGVGLKEEFERIKFAPLWILKDCKSGKKKKC